MNGLKNVTLILTMVISYDSCIFTYQNVGFRVKKKQDQRRRTPAIAGLDKQQGQKSLKLPKWWLIASSKFKTMKKGVTFKS